MTTIINIRHKMYTFGAEDILKLTAQDNFKYKYIPLVVYNKIIEKDNILTEPEVVSFNNKSPFSLFEIGTSIDILRTYIGKNRISKEDLISAKKAFGELKRFALQCAERVVSDLCCDTILKELKNAGDQDTIFFIEKSASEKMLGRLASLFLDMDRVTVCFLVFNPADLMTTVMSHQTGKLHFDIHRLMNSKTSDYLGPYPGDSENSLIQTYFYKPPSIHEEGEYRPMRIDIFSQGQRRDQIEHKKNIIKEMLKPDSKFTEPSRGEAEARLLMPMGFENLKGKLDKEEIEIKEKLLELK